MRFGVFDALGLDPRGTDGLPLRAQEGVRHRAADADHVGAPHHRFEHREFVGHLGAAQQAQEGSRGVEHAAQVIEFRAAAGRRLRRASRAEPCRRSTRARGARCRRRRSRRSSASFASDAAKPGSFCSSSAWKRRFSSSSTSPSREFRDGRLRVRTDARRDERNRPAEQLAESLRDRSERVLRVHLALRPAEVRRQHHARTGGRAASAAWEAWRGCACRRRPDRPSSGRSDRRARTRAGRARRAR